MDDVVVLNGDLEEEGLSALTDARRLYPPGWPKDALDPWIRKAEAMTDEFAHTMIDPTEE
jgi:hypothetical protein